MRRNISYFLNVQTVRFPEEVKLLFHRIYDLLKNRKSSVVRLSAIFADSILGPPFEHWIFIFLESCFSFFEKDNRNIQVADLLSDLSSLLSGYISASLDTRIIPLISNSSFLLYQELKLKNWILWTVEQFAPLFLI